MTCNASESEAIQRLLTQGFHIVQTTNQAAYLVLQKNYTQVWIDKKTCQPVVVDRNVHNIATGGGCL